MAYDAADGYEVLYTITTSRAISQTWMFQHNSWTQLNLSVQPPPRVAESLVYDAADGYLILYGGASTQPLHRGCHLHIGDICDDTWKFSHGVWTQLNTTGRNPYDLFQVSAYDPTLHGVVFGVGYNWHGTRRENDTWYLLRHDHWSQISLSNGSKNPDFPTNRIGAIMTFDAATHFMTLVANPGTGPPANPGNISLETWTFANDTWTELSFGSTVPKSAWNFPYVLGSQLLSYDPKLKADLLVGAGLTRNETWEFSGRKWTQVSFGVGGQVGPSYVGAANYFPPAKGVLVYGFSGGTPAVASTWLLS